MKVAIVGTGYVGLVTGACLADAGHDVTCIDVLPERVRSINDAVAPFFEPGLPEVLARVSALGRLRATTELAPAVRQSEVTMVAVGTPFREGRIDLSFVAQAARDIGAAIRGSSAYHVVAVKSTVVPGTTANVVRPALEAASGKAAGEFGLCMNPEFLAEGSAVADFGSPDRIVVGHFDAGSRQPMESLYASFDCPKLHVRLNEAELIKYTANSLLATLISFSNEIAHVAESMPEMDIDLVMQGVHLDKRLSPIVAQRRVAPGVLSFLRPGCGYGGSCFPKDVDALRAFARDREVATPVLDSVVRVNRDRPAQVLQLAADAGIPLRGNVVAVLGLAFKPGTDDLRESPALKMIDLLLDEGAQVRVHDPVALEAASRVLPRSVKLVADPAALLRGAGLAIVVTPWPQYSEWDWNALAGLMANPVVLDARNALHLPPAVSSLRIGRGCREQRRAA